MAADDRRIVYQTGIGRIPICSRCGQPQTSCRCREQTVASSAPRDGFVRIARDKKGRGGKTMTVITGVPLGAGELASLTQDLKRLCGSGGTVKDGEIQIQGDHRDKLEDRLKALGYKVKRVGG